MATFQGEFEKQQRITNYLSRKLHHSSFRWVKLFPVSGTVSPASFHAEADNKGWTVVVGIMTDGSVVGGFTTIGWTSAANPLALNDPYAFLFSMPHNGAEVFFPATGAAQVTHNVAEGPAFGAKELFFSLAPGHTGSACKDVVNFQSPVANGVSVVVDPTNPTAAWTPDAGPKQLVAVEVYQLVPAEYSSPTNQPTNQNKLGLLTGEFKALSKLGLTRLNVCFVGDAKAGKSTTINNLISAFSTAKRLQTHAFATNLKDHGTTSYNKYPLSLIDDIVEGFTPLPTSFNDMPGFTDVHIDKIETLIPFIAQGRVPKGWKLSDNPAFLPAQNASLDDWIHLFVIVIPADAINNPVKMAQYRRIEANIRAQPPNDTYPHYPNLVYLVTQMDDPARGGDVLLSSHPTHFEVSQLWATYKKKLLSPQGLGHANVLPIVNVTEQEKEIPEANLSVLLEAWYRILRAIKTNASQWKLE